MAKRMVNTVFWTDNYIMDLEPDEKLLFLYLMTNESVNMLGIFEIHLRKISLETGIDLSRIQEIFVKFNKDRKASYLDGHVCLHNFTKHQSYNANMKAAAYKTLENLPPSIGNADLWNPY